MFARITVALLMLFASFSFAGPVTFTKTKTIDAGGSGSYYYAIATADTDNDGNKEIIYSSHRYLAIFENDGDNTYSFRYNYNTLNYLSWGVAAGDVDGDGWGEIAITNDEGYINVFEATANNNWVRRTTAGTSLCPGATVHSTWGCHYGVSYSNIVYADSDNDGNYEFIWGARDGSSWDSLHILEGASNDVYNHYNITNINPSNNADNTVVAVADADNDSNPEIYTSGGFDIAIYESTGSANTYNKVHTLQPFANYPQGLAVAEVDGDTNLELVVGYTVGYIYIFEYNGALTSWASRTFPAEPNPSYRDIGSFRDPHALLAGMDSDGDGYKEIFAGEYGESAEIIANTGPNTYAYQQNVGDTSILTKGLAYDDTDLDGKYEIIIGSYDDIDVWESPNVIGGPQFCKVLTTPGEVYELSENVTEGAPNSFIHISGHTDACIIVAADNVVVDCNGFEINSDGNSYNTIGILVNDSVTNATIRNCRITDYETAIYIYNSSDNRVINNTLYNNPGNTFDMSGTGILLMHTTDSSFINNTAYNNTFAGFRVSSSPFEPIIGSPNPFTSQDNNFTNNTAYNNTHGFYITETGPNSFTNNTIYGNSDDGIRAIYGVLNFTNNSVYGNDYEGFDLTMIGNSNFTNNIIHSNVEEGLYAETPRPFGNTPVKLINNSVYANSKGFYLDDVNSYNLVNNSFYLNNIGLYSLHSGITATNDHYYDNELVDFFGGGDYGATYLTNVIFDNPAGDYQNFTNLSLEDSYSSEQFYSISWSPEPAVGVPAEYLSFEGKFVNIGNHTGTDVSLDNITWHWRDDETANYTEELFELWEHNNWTPTGAILDTGTNTLSLTNLAVNSTRMDYSFGADIWLYDDPGGHLEGSTRQDHDLAGVDKSVAVDGDYAIIGAKGNYTGFSDPGTIGEAFIFERNGTEWIEVAKLNASDASLGDQFGYSVDINGDYAIVGATIGAFPMVAAATCGGEAAYIFYNDPVLGWTEVEKLTANDSGGCDLFGQDVAIFGNYAAVAAPWANTNRGTAYVFKQGTVGWTQVANFTASDAASFDSFGRTISMSGGDRIIVGAPNLDAAYIFERTGETWTETAKLNVTVPAGYFGWSVDIWGDYAIVGDYSTGFSALGGVIEIPGAYIFHNNGATWTEQAGLPSPYGTTDWFGYSVAITDNYALVGAPGDGTYGAMEGQAHLYKRSGTTWSWVDLDLYWETWNWTTDNRDYLGYGVEMSETDLIIGAPGDGVGEVPWNEAGEAYIVTKFKEGRPYDVFGILEAPLGGNDDKDEEDDELSVSLRSSCEGNIVTVKEGGDPVEGADVTVMNGGVDSGTTDSNGKFTFEGCSYSVVVYANKDGYLPDSITKELIDCIICEEGCQRDADCPEDMECTEGECVPIDCDCGTIENRQCVEYACCTDEDCPAGQVCENNQCAPEFECTTDDDCEDSEYCDIPPGAAGGSCRPVTGECGYPENHKWVQYACGDEPGCPSCPPGQDCENHECVPRKIDCPTVVFVGDEGECTATVGNDTCANCDYQVIDPTGEWFTGRTDENGSIVLPFKLEGEYKVALLKDGEVVSEVIVTVLPKAPPTEPEKPTQILEDVSLLWLLVLLALLLVAFLYWRRRKGEKIQKPKPEAKKKPKN